MVILEPVKLFKDMPKGKMAEFCGSDFEGQGVGMHRYVWRKFGFVIVAVWTFSTACNRRSETGLKRMPSPLATTTQPTTTAGATEAPTPTVTNLVLGESSFTSNKNFRQLSGTAQSAYPFTNGTKFILSEPNYARIRIWNSIPSSLDNPDVVLGQANMFTTLSNDGNSSPTASTLSQPSGVWTDGTQLIVADRANNRVLIWNTWPTTNKQAADVVVGQPDFVTATGNVVTDKSLYLPYAVNVIAGKLVVSDSQNLRVMVWNNIPNTNYAPANMVWGQTNFTAASGSTNANTVYSSTSPVQYGGGKIIVASGNRSRIAFFNGIPTANNPTIEFVIGQPTLTAQDFGSPECIATFTGGCAASGGLNWPAIHSDGTRLFVSDQAYNRILVWNAVPTAANTAPNFVLGQSDFNGVSSNAGGVSAASLSRPGHMTSTSTHLYVVDEFNNRLLRFPLANLSNKMPADLVYGIDSATRGSTATTSNEAMAPEGVYKLGTKLAIADGASNRVLLYNSAPAANNVRPDVVLGQSDFMRVGANAGGLSASSLYAPGAVTLVGDGTDSGTKVIVSDTSNNRVLIWNTWPSTNKQAADVVIGQAAFTTNTANSPSRSLATMAAPAQTWSDGTKLLVADTNNQRVLYFSSFPATNGASANFVLGQATISAAVSTTCNASTLRAPSGVWSDGTKIYASSSHNRVLIWSGFPTAHGATATAVLGQPDFVTCTTTQAAALSTNFSGPKHIFGSSTKFAVADTGNHRILVWNTLPTITNTPAAQVLGQTTFTTATANGAGTQAGLSGPGGIWFDNTSVVVGDRVNKAVRIWKQFPTANGVTYDLVNTFACQSSTSWCWSGTVPGVASASDFGANAAMGIGNKLVVADADRNRLLIWNSPPTESYAAADVVLGQANFTSANPNANALASPTASSLWSPSDLATDGTRLFVVDQKNHRILIWNTVPTTHNAEADIVLGQPNVSTRNSNPNGPLTAADLSFPSGMVISGSKLIVSDQLNHRVLIWNTLPTMSYTPADVIIGQTTESARFDNMGGAPSGFTVKQPSGITLDSMGRLYLADRGNNRVLVWNSIPTTNGKDADLVLGQADFSSVLCNRGQATKGADSLCAPGTVSAFGGKIYVYDSSNNRTIMWSESNISMGALAESHANGADISTTLQASSETTYTPVGNIVSYGAYRLVPDGFRLLMLPLVP